MAPGENEREGGGRIGVGLKRGREGTEERRVNGEDGSKELAGLALWREEGRREGRKGRR